MGTFSYKAPPTTALSWLLFVPPSYFNSVAIFICPGLSYSSFMKSRLCLAVMALIFVDSYMRAERPPSVSSQSEWEENSTTPSRQIWIIAPAPLAFSTCAQDYPSCCAEENKYFVPRSCLNELIQLYAMIKIQKPIILEFFWCKRGFFETPSYALFLA